MQDVPMWGQVLVAFLTFLLGGTSVALFNYVKFNGRQIATETLLKAHMEDTKEWRGQVNTGMGKLEKRLDTIILHLGVTEPE